MPPTIDSNMNDSISKAVESPICLILISIANLGISLSKLIEIEALELHLLASVENDRIISVSDIIAFNKSIQRIIKKIYMLRTLIDIKLEYINKLKCIFIESADSSNIVRTVSANYKNDVTSKAIAEIKDNAEKARKKFNELINPLCTAKNMKYCLKGRGHGRISKLFDLFNNGIGVIQLYINDNCNKADFVCYTSMKDTKMMNFTAYPKSLITTSEVTCDCKKIKIEGIGSITQKERFKPDKRDIGSFELTVFFDTNRKEKIFFQMSIKATNSDFKHMSGKIDAECSNLQIKEEQ